MYRYAIIVAPLALRPCVRGALRAATNYAAFHNSSAGRVF